MIVIEFNNNGFVIVGDGLEIKLACSPTKFWDPIDQLYIILIKALAQIKNKKGDVICYNDSRIIDELNGNISPISETSRIFHETIMRDLVPSVKGIVLFRKRTVEIPTYSYIDPPVSDHPYKKGGTIEKFKKCWLRSSNETRRKN